MKLPVLHLCYLLTATVPVSCQTTAQDPLIYGHRGARGDAPENTLAAVERAWELGADGVECDFRMTKDGMIVSIHNATTGDATGGKKDLAIATTTYAELRKLDVGGGERIPTLEEVLVMVPRGKRILIEIKCGEGKLDERFMPALMQALKKSTVKPEHSAMISFHKHVITECREKLPDYNAIWLVIPDEKQYTPEAILFGMRETGATGLGLPAHPDLAKHPKFRGSIQALRKQGRGFLCWMLPEFDVEKTVNEFKELGVESIITDHPARVRKALATGQ